ncbi:hypothetical protein [Kitasatospora sp. NPDC088134]|uniref:hypothetical protein n=1 Tax=Kitasatospora sp. NPDC088134 TaxID=3364071 RepID=UPI0037FD76E0
MISPDTELAAALDAFCALLEQAAQEDPDQEDPDQEAYERREQARLVLARALAAEPAATARLADRVFRALTLEHSMTHQLTDPLIAAIGHRAFLEGLVPLVRTGGWTERRNAAAAAYHLRAYRDPAPIVALREEHRRSPIPPEEQRERAEQALRLAYQAAEPYEDVWPRFWLAVLECFTACPDAELRRDLASAFPLEHPDHLPTAAPLLATARRRLAQDSSQGARAAEWGAWE